MPRERVVSILEISVELNKQRIIKENMLNPFKQFDARTKLAFIITSFAVIGTSALSITIIVSGDKEKVDQRAQLVLNSTLPLFGTWVGTVLAYYFARENFEAASRSTERFAQLSSQSNRDDLQSMPVVTVMITKSKMFFVDDLTMTIRNILKKLNEKGLRRLPILESGTGYPKSLVYYEDLSKYYAPTDAPDETPPQPTDAPDKTLDDFLKDPQTSKKTFAIIDSEATIALAKESMKKIPECRDVFVTETGKPESEVIGFLTNVDIDKFSKS
jgi:hypothetical protein